MKNFLGFFKKSEKRQLNKTNILTHNEITSFFADENSSMSNLDEIRAVARERVRFDAIPHAFIKLGESNIVGNGFKLKIEQKQKNIPQNLIKKIDLEFNEFCKSKNIDITGKHNFNELMRVMSKVLLTDGEILFKFIRDENINEFGLSLQLLDIERLDTNKNNNNTRYGVELDNYGRPYFYHFRTQKNSRNGLMSSTTSDVGEYAKDIVHAFKIDQAEQTRGKSFLTPALKLLKDLATFEKIAIKAAQTGTLLSAYITSDTTEDYNSDVQEIRHDVSLDVGGLYKLQPGEEIKSIQGNYPTEIYRSYSLNLVKRISRALGLSPTFLANEWEGANYAVARFMSNEDRQFYRNIQNFMISSVITPIFNEFLKGLVLNKKYPPKILDLAFSFSSSGFEEIDPIKTEKAKKLKLLNGTHSLLDISGENGKDFNDTQNDMMECFNLLQNLYKLSEEQIQEVKAEYVKNLVKL